MDALKLIYSISWQHKQCSNNIRYFKDYLQSLSWFSTIGCALVRIVSPAIITDFLASTFWGNPSPISSDMVTIHPSLTFPHAFQVKSNWIITIRDIKVCLLE